MKGLRRNKRNLRAVHTYASLCCAARFVNATIEIHVVTVCRAAAHSNAQRMCERPFTSLIFLAKYAGWPKKRGHRLMTIILSNLNRLKIFTGRFLSKFAVKWILKIPPHLAYVATLPCETLKQAINDELQGNVATYLKCGDVANNQIKGDLLLSL